MPETVEDRIARLLGDRYELVALLGRGGFAGVYRVRNLRLQRTEALKVLSEALTEDPDFAKRFEQEARVAAALDHPNIVKIYDFGAVEGFFWFSMQFIDGESVGRQVKSRGRFEDAAAARIIVPVLDALAYSHARGVIHRDIKPDNILLDRSERPYLTDFGVAKSELSLVKTHAGTLLGSPAYMSPEQLQGKPLDGRSDLYSLGVTVYKMLSGALPFTGDDTFRATMKRLSENPEPLSRRRSDVHPALEAIVMRALERDPARRFPDVTSMRDELETYLADVTPPRTRISSIVSRSDEGGPSSATPTGVRRSATEVSAPAPISAHEMPTLVTPRSSSAPAVARRPFPWGWIALAGSLAILAAVILLVRAPGPQTEAASRVTANPAAGRRAHVVATRRGTAVEPSAAPATPTIEPAAPTAAPLAMSEPTALPARAVPIRVPRRAQLPRPMAPTRVAPPTAAPTPPPVPTSAAIEAGKRTPPEILEQAPLRLSHDLIAAHHNESIGLVVIIAADGTLKSARVISPVCPECDRAALEALRRFRFRAAMDAKGNPIEGTFGFAIRIP